jgi:hypothetical protein
MLQQFESWVPACAGMERKNGYSLSTGGVKI